MTNSILEVKSRLAEASGRPVERLEKAIKRAEAVIGSWTHESHVAEAVEHFFEALVVCGESVLGEGDPQRVEDELYSVHPWSPIQESVVRLAWVAFADTLAQTGERPVYAGDGRIEAWAFSARSKPVHFADPSSLVERVAELYGKEQQVVLVHGPGKSSFLAAVRRTLLSRHGSNVLVPPILTGACDAIGGTIERTLQRQELPAKIYEGLKKLNYDEDYLGVLGRMGTQSPVGLLIDDAQLQSRSIMMGLPLYMEPSSRDALLVLAAPTACRESGPLDAIIRDAREREALTEIELPGWGRSTAQAVLEQAVGSEANDELIDGLLARCSASEVGVESFSAAQGWVDAVLNVVAAGQTPIEAFNADVELALPSHPRVRAALTVGAVEGQSFHGISVAGAFEEDEDFVEDLLFDDELEIDGRAVGGCQGAVDPGCTRWCVGAEGVAPVYRFADSRLPSSLLESLSKERRALHSKALFGALLSHYGATQMWQASNVLWRLADEGARHRLHGMLLQTADAGRVEAGFRRLTPILESKNPYRLAVSRLYRASMEAGMMGMQLGKIQLADQAFSAAAAAAERMGQIAAAGEAMARLGEMRLALALPEPAKAALELAEKLLIKGAHQDSATRLGLLKAEVAVLEGDVSGAVDILKRTASKLATLKDSAHQALACSRLGRLLYEQGDVDAATAVLKDAIACADTCGDTRAQGASRICLSFVLGEHGDTQQAFAHLQNAAQAFQGMGLPLEVLEIAAADLQRRSGQPGPARERLEKAAEHFKGSGAVVQWAEATHGCARCRMDEGEYTDAVKMLTEVRGIRVRARDRFGLVRAIEDLANAYQGQGDLAGAYQALCEARYLASTLGLRGHVERLNGAIAPLAGDLDGHSTVDLEQLERQGCEEIDGIEARWKAPPQPTEENPQVH